MHHLGSCARSAQRAAAAAALIALALLVRALGGPAVFYAGPTRLGKADCFSSGDPCLIADAWPKLTAGSTLLLLDGRYTGDASMINPPSAVHGASGQPITIAAANDGAVEIDGQSARKTVYLKRGNDWITIRGINAHDSNWYVWALEQVNYCRLERTLGWNAPLNRNIMIYGINYGQSNVIEDSAGWGPARKIIVIYSTNGPNWVRRFWGREEASENIGPKWGASLCYDCYDSTFENVIMTWDQSRMRASYVLQSDGANWASPPGRCLNGIASGGLCYMGNKDVDQPKAALGSDGNTTRSSVANSRILGSIAYLKTGVVFQPKWLVMFDGKDGITIKDTVAFIPVGSFAGKRPFGLGHGTTNTGLSISNSTGFKGGGAASAIDESWSRSNLVESVSPATLYAAGESIYNTTRGANLCCQYVNGVKTSSPLWPWPMNARIKTATAGAVDVDATIQAMFGVYPANVRTPSPSPTFTLTSTSW